MRDLDTAPLGRWLLPGLVVLFFFSGFSALIYQVLWLRMLAHVFGVTIWAASTVLAVFMGGLALGSFGVGRLADRLRSPLSWFGVAEILVGATALASPAILTIAERGYVWVASSIPDELGALTVLRFVLAMVVLIVPTTLMGATLPLVVRSSLLSSADLGQRVSTLYASNTAGAIIGTLLAGFVLIGGIGVDASFRLAGAVNLLVGLSALVAGSRGAKWMATLNAADSAPSSRPTVDHFDVPPRARRIVLAVFTLSGLVSLALEVVWFRVLVLFVESTTYAFTAMLAAVLAGIALGSTAITPLLTRRWPWPVLLAIIEMAVGISVLVSVTTLVMTYDGVSLAASAVAPPGREGAQQLVAPILSFVTIFPTSVLLGAAFPLGLRIWATRPRADDRTAGRIGTFYALNVCGAIVGPIVAGFLVLPRLGAQQSLVLLAGITVVSGVLLLFVLPWRSSHAIAGAIAVTLFTVVGATMPDPSLEGARRRHPTEPLLWKGDGVQATATVHQSANGGRRMYLDGVAQAADDRQTLAVHRMIGVLPLALQPDPQRALLIGLGGGVTAGAMASHAAVQVDIVELSETVIEASEWFNHVNNGVLQRPNVRVRLDDGRNFLLLTSTRYDAIAADTIRPFHAGSGNLYSREYFQLARAALSDNGLMVQWVAGLPESHRQALVRTFQSVFPDATLWSNRLLIGSKQPLQLSREAISRRLEDPEWREALSLIGVKQPDDLLKLYVAGPRELASYAGEGWVLSDDRPFAEYFLSLTDRGNGNDLNRVRGNARRDLLGE